MFPGESGSADGWWESRSLNPRICSEILQKVRGFLLESMYYLFSVFSIVRFGSFRDFTLISLEEGIGEVLEY